ncbi:CLUMA_CG006152, isoform A [Clunio marinus]|uniref:CLUMA_CG006152, isoform A n=1 Tax=Clunio marinus TaxID=568069 RepID=A0A1J1HX81_9DIPT|nr:CLUMA_CG006152, isoform A [Clunio marinus]
MPNLASSVFNRSRSCGDYQRFCFHPSFMSEWNRKSPDNGVGLLLDGRKPPWKLDRSRSKSNEFRFNAQLFQNHLPQQPKLN